MAACQVAGPRARAPCQHLRHARVRRDQDQAPEQRRPDGRSGDHLSPGRGGGPVRPWRWAEPPRSPGGDLRDCQSLGAADMAGACSTHPQRLRHGCVSPATPCAEPTGRGERAGRGAGRAPGPLVRRHPAPAPPRGEPQVGSGSRRSVGRSEPRGARGATGQPGRTRCARRAAPGESRRTGESARRLTRHMARCAPRPRGGHLRQRRRDPAAVHRHARRFLRDRRVRLPQRLPGRPGTDRSGAARRTPGDGGGDLSGGGRALRLAGLRGVVPRRSRSGARLGAGG